jgi:diguanylate cyclase (GGDEF)-like protein
MDIRGLGIGISLCLALLYVMLALVVARVGDEPAYRAFRHGGLLGALGLVLNMLQGIVHPVIPFVLGNGLIVASAGWFWIGSSRLVRRFPSPLRAWVLGIAMALLGFWFTFVVPSLGARICANVLLLAVPSAGIALTFLSAPGARRLGRPAQVLGGIQALLALLLLLRALIWLVYGIPSEGILDTHPANTLVYLALLLCYALFAMGLNVLVVLRLVDDTLHLASHDALTATLNRLGLKRALKTAGLDGFRVLLVMDLDHFKAINDAHGHDIGDRLLQRFARILRTHAGPQDLIARMGGEEFLWLSRLTTDPQQLAESLRAAVASQLDDLPLATVSIGVVAVSNHHALPVLLRVADDALYQAKREGRNCVRLASASVALV